MVTILDDRPSVRITSPQAYPGEMVLGFGVSLSRPYDQAVTVNYSTS